MNGKILIASIGIFLLILFVGIYFVYNSIAEETSDPVETSNIDVSEKPHSNSENNTETSSSSAHSPDKPIVNNNKKTNNSNNNVTEPRTPTNYKNNEVVVDQIIPSTVGKTVNTPLPPNVVGAEKEKIEIEITLYDGHENKLLTDYYVAIKYEDKKNNGNFEKYTTDKNGKFIFIVTEPGLLRLQLLTKEFSTHSKILNVLYGTNAYQAKMYKGGSLEVRATNPEGQIVPGLNAKFANSFRPSNSKDSIALEFNIEKNTYLLKNVPIGPQNISFNAIGYQETDIYKIKVESSGSAVVEVRMQPARLLVFDLNIKAKPDLIYVSNVQTSKAKSLSPSESSTGRLPIRSRDQQRNIPIEIPILLEEKKEVFKNQNGLFEYELLVKNAVSVTVEVEGYVSKEVAIAPNSDTYKLNLIEGYSGTLQVNNDQGKPISGAEIHYSSGTFKQVAFSDEKGKTLLLGMTEHMVLNLVVSHHNYTTFNDKWVFDAETNNAKTIVLKEGKGISGQIKFEGKFVAGAKVFLYQSGKPTVVATMESGADGSYFFNKLDGRSEVAYTVSAFHHEYGVATSAEIKFGDKNPVIDLTLAKQKSLTVKLVDHKGEVLANKNITVVNDADNQYSFSVMTNEKGEYEFFNLIHGLYTISLQDSKYKSKEVKSIVPAGVIKLVAKSRDLKKVNIKVAGGKPFTGDLVVTLERNDWPIVVVVDEDGYFIEFQEGEPVVFVRVVFHAQGYGDVMMGPYNKKEDFPNEFNIEFHVGENFKVKVVDDENNNPIPFVTVDIYSGNIKVEALPTNEVGEIKFSYLSGKFFINVKDDAYSPYSYEFDGSQSKELTIRLIKGGGIKGHLTIKKEVAKCFVILQPGDINQQFDPAGNFELLNLIPGEYTISVSRIFKDGKNQIEKIPTRIIIEREKVIEINLDDFQKNQTTLEITVFSSGGVSNERGFLKITDRRGQSVVATTIEGQYTVERIMPGEYLLSYNFQGRVLQKSLAILPGQTNIAEIYVPGSSLTFSVKNAEGVPISKVMVTLYAGEKYRQEDTYIGNQLLTNTSGMGTFYLMPKTPYYFLVEEDFRFNYQINIVGPILLEAGQDQRIDYILPYARKLPKIQVTDLSGKALADVGFLFNDENNNFFQRSLLKEWDFFPYSNAEGFLPENSWPKGNFTLVVGKEGYEFKELAITEDFDVNQLTQIKLNKGSTVTCNFPQTLPYPISVGILNKDGVLLQKPIPYPSRKRHELTVYFENITSGSVRFNDLAAGEYYIGYFWNGSNRLISKQGPIKASVAQGVTIQSTLQLEEF